MSKTGLMYEAGAAGGGAKHANSTQPALSSSTNRARKPI